MSYFWAKADFIAFFFCIRAYVAQLQVVDKNMETPYKIFITSTNMT